MSRFARLLTALIAAFAFTATGLVINSAQALIRTTISGKVVNSDGNPVRGISVLAANFDELGGNEGLVFLYATDTDGTYSGSSFGRLAPGTWTLLFQDSAGRYVGSTRQETLVAGDNPLSDTALQLGGTVSGTVTSPSGIELKGVSIYGDDPTADSQSFFYPNYGDSDVDGSYEVRGMAVGDHRIHASFDEEAGVRRGAAYTIAAEGAQVGPVDVTNVKVPVTASLRGSSPSVGKLTFTATVSGTKYGVTNPGGRFDLYDGSTKILAGASLFTGGTRTVTLSRLRKGTHSFKIRYLGFTDTTAKTSKPVSVYIK